jgi:hypothetical protein
MSTRDINESTRKTIEQRERTDPKILFNNTCRLPNVMLVVKTNLQDGSVRFPVVDQQGGLSTIRVNLQFEPAPEYGQSCHRYCPWLKDVTGECSLFESALSVKRASGWERLSPCCEYTFNVIDRWPEVAVGAPPKELNNG